MKRLRSLKACLLVASFLSLFPGGVFSCGISRESSLEQVLAPASAFQSPFAVFQGLLDEVRNEYENQEAIQGTYREALAGSRRRRSRAIRELKTRLDDSEARRQRIEARILKNVERFIESLYLEQANQVDNPEAINRMALAYVSWWNDPARSRFLSERLKLELGVIEKLYGKNSLIEVLTNSLLRMDKREAFVTMFSTGFSLSHLNKPEVGGYDFADAVRNSQGDFLKALFGVDKEIFISNNKWVAVDLDPWWITRNADLDNKTWLGYLYEFGWARFLEKLEETIPERDAWPELVFERQDVMEEQYAEPLLPRLKKDIRSRLELNRDASETWKIQMQRGLATLETVSPASLNVVVQRRYYSNLHARLFSALEDYFEADRSADPNAERERAQAAFHEALDREIESDGAKLDEISNVLDNVPGLDRNSRLEDVDRLEPEDRVYAVQDRFVDRDGYRDYLKNVILRRDYIRKVVRDLERMRDSLWDELASRSRSDALSHFEKKYAYPKSVEIARFLLDLFEGESHGWEWLYLEMWGRGSIPYQRYYPGEGSYPNPRARRGDLWKAGIRMARSTDEIEYEESRARFHELFLEIKRQSILNERDFHFVEKQFFGQCAEYGVNFDTKRSHEIFQASREDDVGGGRIEYVATIDGDEHRLVFKLGERVFHMSFDFDNFQAGDMTLRRLGILTENDGLFFQMHEQILSILADEMEGRGTRLDLENLGNTILERIPREVSVDLNPFERNDLPYLYEMRDYLRENRRRKDVPPTARQAYAVILDRIAPHIEAAERGDEAYPPFKASLPLVNFYFEALRKREHGSTRIPSGVWTTIGITGAGSVTTRHDLEDFRRTDPEHPSHLPASFFVDEFTLNDELVEVMKFNGRGGSFQVRSGDDASLERGLDRDKLAANEYRKSLFLNQSAWRMFAESFNVRLDQTRGLEIMEILSMVDESGALDAPITADRALNALSKIPVHDRGDTTLDLKDLIRLGRIDADRIRSFIHAILAGDAQPGKTSDSLKRAA